MAKRYYKVRAVNPGPPKSGAAGGVTTQGREKRTGVYTLYYVPSRDEPKIKVIYRGDYAGGKLHEVTLYFDSPESGKDAWSSIRGDYDVGDLLAKHGYDEYGNRLRTNPRRGRNVAEGGITIEEQAVLEDLAREARESEDDWGIQQGVREYLDDAYANRAEDTPAEFLDALQQDVWWHYGHSGEGTEAEGADPMYSKESAKRAEAAIGRARKRLSKRTRNPRFRYAAVPVDDDGTETAHVVRGRRRKEMVRTVARAVPPDAVVDLGRTRTFATKHEATKYAEKTSPRVNTLSRRISNGGR